MLNQSNDTCFYSDDFEDYCKKKITLCWTEKLWDKHVNKHIEIVDPVTTSKIIKEVLLNPSLVITGQRPGNAGEVLICYYKEHKRNKNDVYFTKVIIGCIGSKLYVKTVFMEWALCMYAVQEKKYDFKELYRDTNTYL